MFTWSAPSEKSAGDQAEWRVFVVVPGGTDRRWVDYIPVKNVTPARADSYDHEFDGDYVGGGAIRVEELESVAGLTAWVDYVPVSEDAGAAGGQWRFDNNGWIPVSGMNP